VPAVQQGSVLTAPDTAVGLPTWRDRLPLGTPLRAAAAAAAAGTTFAVLRLLVALHGHITLFVQAGYRFADDGPVRRVTGTGFDGQFAYRLARAPWDLSIDAYGAHIDTPLRAQRIGYPVLAWLVSAGGRPALLPWALVLVNIVALGVLAGGGAIIARASGRSPWWGLFVASPWCFLFTIGFDVTELVAAAFLVWGLIALRTHRPLLAALSFSLGALTRESVLITVAAVALTRVVPLVRRRTRLALVDASWLVPVGTFAAWQVVCHHAYGAWPLSSGGASNLGAPVVGLATAVGRWASDLGMAANIGIQLVLLLVLTASVVPSLRRPTTAPVHERVAWALWIPYALCFTALVWTGWGEFRVVSDLQVLSTIILLSAPGVPRKQAGVAGLGWAITFIRRVVSV